MYETFVANSADQANCVVRVRARVPRQPNRAHGQPLALIPAAQSSPGTPHLNPEPGKRDEDKLVERDRGANPGHRRERAGDTASHTATRGKVGASCYGRQASSEDGAR